MFVVFVLILNIIKDVEFKYNVPIKTLRNNTFYRTYHPPVMCECADITVGPVHKFWHLAVVALYEPRLFLWVHYAARAPAHPLSDIDEITQTKSEIDSDEHKQEDHPHGQVNDTNLEFRRPDAGNN